MDRFYSECDRISKFVRQPALANFAARLNFFSGIRAPFFYRAKFSSIWRFCRPYRHANIMYGVNAAQQSIERGDGFAFELYSQEERGQDKSKNEAALFRFHAQDGAPYALVLAGGAYMSVCSIVEGFPVAAALNEWGYNAFVLVYRHGKENPFPAPVEDLQRAVRMIGENAQKWRVSPENYAVFGFSAGGNLAAQFGTANVGYAAAGLGRPAMLALCYPAVDVLGGKKFFGLEKAVWGKDKKNHARLREESDIFAHIGETYPPGFLWHCEDDKIVDCRKNSVRLAKTLEELRVPCALRLYSEGGHGIGLGIGTSAEDWLQEAVAFWQSQIEK